MPCGHLSELFRGWCIGTVTDYRGGVLSLTGVASSFANIASRTHPVHEDCRCSLHSVAFLQHFLTQPITCKFCNKWQLHCLLLCWSLHEGFSGFADWLNSHAASGLAQVQLPPSEDLLRRLTLASAALKLAVSEYTAYQQQIQNAPQHEPLPVQNGG